MQRGPAPPPPQAKCPLARPRPARSAPPAGGGLLTIAGARGGHMKTAPGLQRQTRVQHSTALQGLGLPWQSARAWRADLARRLHQARAGQAFSRPGRVPHSARSAHLMGATPSNAFSGERCSSSRPSTWRHPVTQAPCRYTSASLPLGCLRAGRGGAGRVQGLRSSINLAAAPLCSAPLCCAGFEGPERWPGHD